MHRINDSSIVLKKFEPIYVEDLLIFRNNPNVTRYLGGFSTGYSRQDLLDWIQSHRGRDDEVLYAVVDTQVDRCVGHVGLYQIDCHSRKAEFAILLGLEEYQGKGLGEAISRIVLEYGFKELNLNKITLSVISTNMRAIHLYEKLGFSVEGRLRQEIWRGGEYLDLILMSILQSEWAHGVGFHRQ